MRKHEVAHESHTQALLQSLLKASLLVGDLDSSSVFDRDLLVTNADSITNHELTLNYQQKLGHLYEDALSFLLENADCPSLKLISKNVQIFDEKKITRGELDYLLKYGDKTIHLELAVKFYLIHEEDGVFSFPGPDPRDNWDNKLKRLETHQLKMAASEDGRRFLLENYGIEEVEVQHLIYGKIFDHVSKLGVRETVILPRAVVAGTETYPWIYLAEWDQYVKSSQARFIPKHLWPLSTAQFDEDILSTLMMVDRIEYVRSMSEYPSCLMIWSDELGLPLFVVPDHWPEFA